MGEQGLSMPAMEVSIDGMGEERITDRALSAER